MADAEKKRLFIGGLHHALQEEDLRERFGRHGTISSLEIKTKKDSKGNPIKTFAHLDIAITENGLKKCMSIYNNAKWNGNTMQIQMAKESFITRLERERTFKADKEEKEARPKKPSHQAVAEKRLEENFEKAGVSEFIVKGKVPGTQIEGEKNWVVGKYGRVLPVVYIRRKDKQKIVCCDPSKYSHHLKKFKTNDKVNDDTADAKLEQLTWDIPESHSEVSMKRKGIFTSSRSMIAKRKRVKENIVLKRDQRKLHGMPKMKDSISVEGQNESDFDDDDYDDDGDNEDSSIVPTTKGPVQAIEVDEGQPTDFEIVRDGSSVMLPKAKSMFETEPGYDSDDRDSVDTDELCTLVKSSSKNSAGSQANLSRAAEREKAALAKGHEQAVCAMVSTVQQAHGEIEESDGSRSPDESAKLDDSDSGDDGWRSDSSEKCEEHTEQYRTYKVGNDFEPLISKSQGHEETNDLVVNHDGNEEDGKDDEEDDDVHQEAGERDDANQDSDKDDGDQETWGSPIARFDFEPLILDRAAISQTTLTETSGDLPEIGCHATENKEVLGDCEADENDESNVTEEDSDENNESEELIDKVYHTEVKTHNNLDNKKEMTRSSEEKGQEKTLSTVTLTEGKGKSDNSPKATTTATVTSPDENKPLGVPGTLKSNAIQQKYDKNGRLLSKAATKKLAREEAEKQKEANERRLESMKQQQRALINRHVAIKGALSAVDDKDKKQGKHITFDDSEEEEEDAESETVKHGTRFIEEKIQGSISLFESDSDADSTQGSPSKDRVGKMWDDDDEDDDEDDGERFRIKPQYAGEAGQKLIRMEARYGGDTRFKLDTRFLDEEGNAEVSDGAPDDPSSDLLEEKSRSLAILQNMLGTQVVASSKPVEPNFKDPCQLHYDPSRDEHSKYELPDDQQDESDAKTVEQELQREKRKMEEERSKMPEVSKEKFFEVSRNLKDAFSGGEGRGEGGGGVKEDDGNQDSGGGGMFTFFGGDDSGGEDPPSQLDESATVSDQSLLLSKKFKYDSSDDEDSLDGKTNQLSENVAEEDLVTTSVPQVFFFQKDDPRLTAGSQKFCHPEDQDALRATWKDMKSQLQNDFRKRHQKAVRDQKTLKKWHNKPVKSKTKK